jgi:hypothetical protein
MPRRTKFKTRRASARHNFTEGAMPIFTREYIASAVKEARAIDKKNGADAAIQRVADLTHISPEIVTEISREEAYAEALIEDQRRNRQLVEA